MNADEEIRNGELDEVLAGEDETALGTAPGERDIGADEPGGAEPPPAPPGAGVPGRCRDRRHRHARRGGDRRAGR